MADRAPRILLVDDERNVRRSTQLLLQNFGFEVLLAKDGVEGVEVFRAHAPVLRAVLLDLTMPRKDGKETLRELRQIAPEVPVILTSGYGATSLDEPGASSREPSPDAVLAKPYSADELFRILQRVMRRVRRE